MSLEEEFSEQLDKTPHDWDLRLIYSDLLEELGREDDAGLQRIFAERNISPFPAKKMLYGSDWITVEGFVIEWQWYSVDYLPNGTYTLPIHSSSIEWRLMGKDWWPTWRHSWPTRTEAERAVKHYLLKKYPAD